MVADRYPRRPLISRRQAPHESAVALGPETRSQAAGRRKTGAPRAFGSVHPAASAILPGDERNIEAAERGERLTVFRRIAGPVGHEHARDGAADARALARRVIDEHGGLGAQS